MPPLAAVPDLERELDALFALPLEEFTQARNDLGTRLRKAHQSEAAAQVRGLKKPTIVAWAANQLARGRRDLVDELLDAGAQLRDVQQHALSGQGDRARLAEATGRERDAVRALVAAARSDLGPRATPQMLDRLTQTLRAAAIDEQVAPTLAAGRLTEELRAVGFGPLEAVAARPPRPSDIDRKAARERIKALAAEARHLADAAHRAEQAAASAEREATRLHEEAGRLRQAADQASKALAEAESKRS
ncbi:MAG: hypothetical protein ACXVRJ_15085 [Gaiellaceae bacterium]